METSTLQNLKTSSKLPYSCSQLMSPVKPWSSSLILSITFLVMPLTPTHHWSWLRAECFRRLGAKSVLVAEGPGHQRDTQLVLSQSGYQDCLRSGRIRFVDLNRAELVRTRLRASYTGMKQLWLSRTVLEADFLVSMPKVKAHHWSGVTLSMKNMFGIVPGMKYGWPKNLLHWRGIQQSIVDLVATVPIHFVIADAIVCMEGNGPLAGSSRWLDRIVLSDDPVAADATCARMMGLVPERVPHIAE